MAGVTWTDSTLEAAGTKLHLSRGGAALDPVAVLPGQGPLRTYHNPFAGRCR